MKLTESDLPKFRAALLACKVAGLDTVVISEGQLRGLGDKRNAAIFSELKLSIDPVISMGIARVSELEKRISMFGDLVEIELDVNDAKKVRKLNIRGKGGKVEFRCTDEKLITYPKTNSDDVGAYVAFTRPEVALLAKGAKTLSVDQLTFQLKRDGSVHLECADAAMDRFEIDLETPAVFHPDQDPYPSVNPFDVSSGGVFLQLLEHMAKDSDTVMLELLKTGNIGMTVHGHKVFAIPRVQIGD